MTDWTADVHPQARRLGRFVFGDRVGLTLFLGLFTALALTWRVGFFIPADEYTIGNTLAAVADGHLAIREPKYSFSLQTQMGLHQHDGRIYGQNYGQAFVTLPLLWLLQAATAVAPFHLVLAGGWSLVAVAFTDQLGTVTGRERLRGVGSVLALGALAWAVFLAEPIDPHYIELAALQLTSLLATAFAGVSMYRLLELFGDRVLGIGGGIAVALALPVGLWATIPKRHAVVATFLIVTVYCFARSRTDGGRSALLATVGAYVAAGLVAWVVSLEGFVAMLTLVFVDVLTGGFRSRRRVAAVVVGAVVGLAPMMLTNVLISGNPMQSPRMLAGHYSRFIELSPTGEVVNNAEPGNPVHISDTPAGTDGSGGGSGGGGGSGESAGQSSGDGGGESPSSLDQLLAPIQGLLPQVGFVFGLAAGLTREGIGVLADVGRMWHIFVRSGYIPGIRYGLNGYAAVEMTVLESVPLFGGLLALPALVLRRLRRESDFDVTWRPWSLDARRQTDLLAVLLAASFTLLYLPRLPLHTQITVRYLLPAYPLALYALFRFEPVREAVTTVPRRFAESYVTTVVIGVVAIAFSLATIDVAVGEAIQFHALLNLTLAVVLACLVGGRVLVPERIPVRAVTTGLAVAAGATTAFVVLARLEYFQHGPFALDIGRVFTDLLPLF